jgi:hypothetical protein
VGPSTAARPPPPASPPQELPALQQLAARYGDAAVTRWLTRTPFVLTTLGEVCGPLAAGGQWALESAPKAWSAASRLLPANCAPAPPPPRATPDPQVPERLAALGDVMGCAPDAAAALAARCPVLIGLRPGVLRERFEGLRGVLGLNRGEVRALAGPLAAAARRRCRAPPCLAPARRGSGLAAAQARLDPPPHPTPPHPTPPHPTPPHPTPPHPTPPHPTPPHPTPKPQAQAVAAATPALLAVQTRLVAAKWARLRGVAARRPEWGRALGAMTPATLAVQLTYSLDRFARLDFIVDCGGCEGGGGGGGGEGELPPHESGGSSSSGSPPQQQQAQQAAAAAGPGPPAAAGGAPRRRRLGEGGRRGFTHLMGMTAAAFEARYPGFPAWAAARGLSSGSGSSGGGGGGSSSSSGSGGGSGGSSSSSGGSSSSSGGGSGGSGGSGGGSGGGGSGGGG